MNKKKIVLWALAFMLASMMGVPLPVSAAAFPDMPNNWSTEALQNALANGLITGVPQKGGLYIKPNSTLKRAEMASIINKAFNCDQEAGMSGVNDVSPQDWHYKHMAMAVQMGSFAKASQMRPNDSITREEAFTVLAKVFKLPQAKDYSTLNRFSDAGSVSEYARSRIASLLENDYIAGNGNWIHPKKYITRAEFAAVMDNIVKDYVKSSGTVNQVGEGNVIVNVSGVTLQNVTISGDLIIADGVGQGDVVIDNVDIEGRLVIRGGGANSVEISGSCVIRDMLVDNVNNQVRVYASKGARITSATVVGQTILDGTFSSVNVTGQDAQVDINGTIEYLNIHAPANIALSRSASVSSAEVQRGAEGTILQGQGNLARITVKADNTQVNTNNTRITVDSGVKNASAGNTWMEAGKVSTSASNAAAQSPPNGSSPASNDSQVTKITLNTSSISFQDGRTDDRDRIKLVATISPSNASNKDVIWDITGSYAGRYELYESSSSSKKVSLDSETDRLTVYVGPSSTSLTSSHTATVTVTTVDGKRSASCKIRVGDEKSETPKADVTNVVRKNSKTAEFTLTNSPSLKGDWRVYTNSTGSSEVDGVSCSNSGSTLSLSHKKELEADTYYVSVTESGHTESSRLALTVSDTGYSVKGTITGEDAKSGLRARIRVKNSSGHYLSNAVTAASNGSYTIDNVVKGNNYTIEATHDGYAAGTSSSFHLSGDVSGKDLVLKRTSYTISGRVLGSDASGGLAASVQLKNSAGSNVGSAVTANASGNYTISGVSPANGYTISVSMSGYSAGVISAFNVTGNVSGKDITLAKGTYSVSGRILATDQSAGLSGATVQLKNSAGSNVGAAQTGTGGVYTINNVSAGNGYTITVFMSGYETGVITAFSVPSANVTGKDLTLAKTAAPAPETFTVSGKVTREELDKGIEGVTLTVKGTSHKAVSGSGGAYSITGVPAGSYTLEAVKAGYETKTESSVSVAGNLTRDIKLKPKEYTIKGTVTNTSGEAISGAHITLDSGGFFSDTAVTNNKGEYTHSVWGDWEYQLEASASDYQKAVETVSISDSSKEQNFTLTPIAAD